MRGRVKIDGHTVVSGIQTIDFTRNKGEVYPLSFEELRAVEKIVHNKDDEAEPWFDQAIIADPSRAPRIVDLCHQLKTPISINYAHFSHAASMKDTDSYMRALRNLLNNYPDHSGEEEACLAKASRFLASLPEPEESVKKKQ